MYDIIKLNDFLTVMFLSLAGLLVLFKITSMVVTRTLPSSLFLSNWPDALIRSTAFISFTGVIINVGCLWYHYPKLYLAFAIYIVFFAIVFVKFYKLMKD